MTVGIVVGVIVAVVIIALVVVLRWADKRDRAKGHVNRGMGDIRSSIRANRENTRAVRRRGGNYEALSPHEFARRQSKRR